MSFLRSFLPMSQAEVRGPDSIPVLHAGEGPRIAGKSVDAIPLRNTKVVHFIRHGLGYHNLVQTYADYAKWKYFDAHLNEKGWAQAAALNKHIKTHNIQVDLVVVSPLTRTLETAVGAFARSNTHTNGDAAANGGDSNLIMTAQDGEEGVRIAQPAVSAYGMPPFVANELCRETLGVHPCDKRRPISRQKEHFPAVDFSLIDSDEDVYWKLEVRETDEELQARARKFAKWLMTLPQKNIAVVSHSGFIYNFMQNCGLQLQPAVAQHLHRHFNNCELRSVVLYDPKADEAATDPLWFVGGDECLANV